MQPQAQPPRISLLLVDDHAVVRGGLRMLLENEADLEIAGEASSGAEALEQAQALNPDIIIMDITLPDISGIEVTRRLLQSGSQARVIALTIHEDEQFFFTMLQAGASGYVPKRAAPKDLLEAIHVVYQGEIYIYPWMTRLLVDDFINRAGRETETRQAMDGLTEREQQILVALASDESSEEIAERLAISPHTVARHRENLMRKLGLHSRTELVKYAIRKGLIKP
jgi:two-component system response regulator NreC